jgi:hypothetical protein
MKKIFTILLAAGSVTFASAQSSHNNSWNGDGKGNSRDVILGQSNSSVYRNNTMVYNDRSFGNQDRDWQIQRINREFDQRIAEVKYDRHLRQYEKNRQIKMLERQRDEQIREVQMRFDNNRNRHDDHFDNRKW